MMAFRLNPDVELVAEWSTDEQAVLEDDIFDEPNILKYIKISPALTEKIVCDVALRCRWMTEYYHLPRLSDPLKNCEKEILKALTSLVEMVPVRLRICPCQTFSLKVKRWFTVLNVKFLIESMVGIPIGKQKLWLDKVELENDMTLADLHFSEGQTLNLRSDSMQIFIRVPSGKLINCRVDGSYTIQNVQEMIEEQEGIHIRSQRLIYGAMQLESSRSLDDYNIKEDATIHLVLCLCGC
ncbi:hypothetical protein IFM89_006569 [Coptis chinensis]|uniref:Ubiquitin-like domain-containing protein n=1 Tax=Coptis chinensis TaxID=261450 RepID=A0A835INC1_9MAGN|nr:hypothetical protein IFM89_006569 [Coptis chinensis]